MGIRILTINLWGRSGDWPARCSLLRQSLAELRPDLVAFQESVVLPDYDQIIELFDHTNVIHQKARSADGGGISIASRFPIVATHELDLHVSSGPREFAAGALMVEVDAGERLVFVNHFPSWRLDQESERERQALMVARKLDELDADHVVVAGDMDADPSSTSIRFWTGRTSLSGFSVCYRDAWEAKHPTENGDTFTARNPLVADPDWPFARIDYILVRCGAHGGPTLRIERCERWLDQPVNGVWASDHFGVIADLEFPS